MVPCGKSSANQRAGRAGRVKDGECFRVYHRKGYDSMPEKVPPEILRVDLVNVLLKLKGLGIRDIMGFDFIERPRDANLARAIDMLYAYGLVDAEFELTALGTKVAELSIDFRNGCMLMNSF